ncbi:zinc-dependent alcohol dehydrogenase family protein [Kineosporiaceae bacterium SCSIO 59966]|nr:zinc-dependent alcohol dehydrogenase family protein [Kineosporiaceae bacterium SCSIO 59966]
MRAVRATEIHAPFDVRLVEVPDPVVEQPTDAVVRITATCVCGSDLWSYRGENRVTAPRRIGHEMVGVVEEVGDAVRTVRPGDFVIAPFAISCGVCDHCRNGVQTSCREDLAWGRDTDACQGERARVPLADGTLVATPEVPDDALVPSLLTLSDVMGTGWHAALAAGVREGGTVAVVGDGAVGLCGVLAASRMGAERIIAMSRHAPRQELARAFGATDVVESRGAEGAAEVLDLTGGTGADSVLECVGTGPAMEQAFAAVRPGGTVGFVGVPHGVEVPVRDMFSRNVALRGGVAPVRAYLPRLLDDVWSGAIDPGRVFDLELPLDDVAEAYRAMHERRAVKVLLHP